MMSGVTNCLTTGASSSPIAALRSSRLRAPSHSVRVAAMICSVEVNPAVFAAARATRRTSGTRAPSIGSSVFRYAA